MAARPPTRIRRWVILTAVLSLLALAGAQPATAGPVRLDRFQAHADAFDGNRAAGTGGYDLSARYVRNKMRKAGYDVRYQTFPFRFFSVEEERGPRG